MITLKNQGNQASNLPYGSNSKPAAQIPLICVPEARAARDPIRGQANPR